MRLPRMGGRAVECTGLENRRLFTEFVSSNLTPSAINKKALKRGLFCLCWARSEFDDRRDEEQSSEQSHPIRLRLHKATKRAR